jgi:hypothetical protein
MGKQEGEKLAPVQVADAGPRNGGDLVTAGADRFDTSIHDQRTTDILDTFARSGAEVKAALSPEQRTQLAGLEKAFATSNGDEMSRLVKELNAGDRTKGGEVLQAFRSDLFALGISNSVSGNEGSGWSLNMFRKAGNYKPIEPLEDPRMINSKPDSEQILSIDPTGRRSTDNYTPPPRTAAEEQAAERARRRGMDGAFTNPYAEPAVPNPQEFLRLLRQGDPRA